MTPFQKNVSFVAAALLVVISVAFGLNFAIQSHQRTLQAAAQALEEQKIEWRKDNIRSIKALTVIGRLSDEEQKRFDAAGDDPERIQQVLVDIHQERVNFWESQLKDAQDRRERLRAIVNSDPYAAYGGGLSDASLSINKDESNAQEEAEGYRFGLERVEAWRPISFTEWQKAQRAQSSPPEPPKTDPTAHQF